MKIKTTYHTAREMTFSYVCDNGSTFERDAMKRSKFDKSKQPELNTGKAWVTGVGRPVSRGNKQRNLKAGSETEVCTPLLLLALVSVGKGEKKAFISWILAWIVQDLPCCLRFPQLGIVWWTGSSHIWCKM